MKKFVAMLLVVAVICCMFSVTALARNPIISPEQGNTTVIPEEPTTPDTPEQPVTPSQPSSPQTGGVNIALIVVLAVVLGGVAVVTTRKVILA